MIRVETRNLSVDDCQKMATLTEDARKGTPWDSDYSIEERAANIERLSKNKAFQILVAVDEQDTIVGWTVYYIAIPLMSFISGFYPTVHRTKDSETIALSLIEAAKQEILDRNHTRMEIELALHSSEHRATSQQLVSWYKKAGFSLAAEEVHMTSDLTKVELPKLDLPDGYNLRKFSEVSTDLLIQSGYEIFNDSMEDLFCSMDHAEKRIVLDYWFDKSKPFHEEASLVLMKDEKIIGFVLSKPKGEQAEIGPVGLIREGRGQGLGTFLLGSTLKKLKEDNMKIVALDTTRNNSLSRKLYAKVGFKDVYYKQFYYWSP